MKRLLALTLALVMVSGCLAGCSEKDPQPANPENPSANTTEPGTTETQPTVSNEPYGVFNNYFLADVDTINPHTWSSSNSDSLIAQTSMYLYSYVPNETGDGFIFAPEFAESEPQQMDSEGKVWNIKVVENAKWQNGDPINIDDLIYSFQMCLDPLLVNSRASQMASDYITIVNAKEYSLQGNAGTVAWEDVGIKKVDDYTMEITCTDPVTALDVKSHFNYSWNVLVHKPTYEACMSADRTTNTYGSTSDKYMSCGRFILKEWVQGAQFTLERNPDYPHAEDIKIEGMVYKIISDRNTALELFLNGELDAVSLGAESIEQYIDDPRVMTSPSSSISSFCVNMGNTNNNGILGNSDFRRALYYAIDREAIAKMVNGVPANWNVPTKCIGDLTTGVTFREMPESNEYIPENLGYDPAKAKEYYDKAMAATGLTQLKLTLVYSESSANYKAASEYLHKTLPEIFGDSFTLELSAVTANVATEMIQGWRKDGNPNSFELSWRGWNTSTTAPWNGLKVYSGTYTNKNEPYFNDEYDELWNKANLSLEAKLDNNYRLELTREMEKITIEDAVTIPIYESPGYTLIADRVNLPVKAYVPAYGFGYTMCTLTPEA